jgi:hypothetical protein
MKRTPDLGVDDLNLELAQFVSKVIDKPVQYPLSPSESFRKGYNGRYACMGQS